MQRRRVIMASVLALVGGLALAGCRQDPGVAAYVGSARFTEADVEKVIAELPAEATDGHREEIRQQIVSMWVIREVGTKLDKELGRATPAPSTEEIAQRVGLPSTAEYVKLRAGFTAAIAGVESNSKPAKPSDDDLRDIFDRLIQADPSLAKRPEVTFDRVRAELGADEQIQKAIGARGTWEAAIRHFNTVVNPRYAPLEFPLLPLRAKQGGKNVAAVAIPLATVAGGAVKDAPAPASPAPAEAPPAS